MKATDSKLTTNCINEPKPLYWDDSSIPTGMFTSASYISSEDHCYNVSVPTHSVTFDNKQCVIAGSTSLTQLKDDLENLTLFQNAYKLKVEDDSFVTEIDHEEKTILIGKEYKLSKFKKKLDYWIKTYPEYTISAGLAYVDTWNWTWNLGGSKIEIPDTYTTDSVSTSYYHTEPSSLGIAITDVTTTGTITLSS